MRFVPLLLAYVLISAPAFAGLEGVLREIHGAYLAVVSPGGKALAFARRAKNHHISEIIVVDLDSGGELFRQQFVGEAVALAVTDSGKDVAFVEKHSSLGSRDTFTATVYVDAQHTPRSTRLREELPNSDLHLSVREGQPELYRVDYGHADGPRYEQYVWPGTFPKGEDGTGRIVLGSGEYNAVIEKNRVTFIDRKGKKRKVDIADGPRPRDAKFSADGKLLSVFRAGEMRIIDAGSGELVRAFSLPKEIELARLQWTDESTVWLHAEGAQDYLMNVRHETPFVLKRPSGEKPIGLARILSLPGRPVAAVRLSDGGFVLKRPMKSGFDSPSKVSLDPTRLELEVFLAEPTPTHAPWEPRAKLPELQDKHIIFLIRKFLMTQDPVERSAALEAAFKDAGWPLADRAGKLNWLEKLPFHAARGGGASVDSVAILDHLLALYEYDPQLPKERVFGVIKTLGAKLSFTNTLELVESVAKEPPQGKHDRRVLKLLLAGRLDDASVKKLVAKGLRESQGDPFVRSQWLLLETVGKSPDGVTELGTELARRVLEASSKDRTALVAALDQVERTFPQLRDSIVHELIRAGSKPKSEEVDLIFDFLRRGEKAGLPLTSISTRYLLGHVYSDSSSDRVENALRILEKAPLSIEDVGTLQHFEQRAMSWGDESFGLWVRIAYPPSDPAFPSDAVVRRLVRYAFAHPGQADAVKMLEGRVSPLATPAALQELFKYRIRGSATEHRAVRESALRAIQNSWERIPSEELDTGDLNAIFPHIEAALKTWAGKDLRMQIADELLAPLLARTSRHGAGELDRVIAEKDALLQYAYVRALNQMSKSADGKEWTVGKSVSPEELTLYYEGVRALLATEGARTDPQLRLELQTAHTWLEQMAALKAGEEPLPAVFEEIEALERIAHALCRSRK